MSAAERMSNLIKDILSFSSIKRKEQFTSTDLNRVLQSVLQDLDLLINQNKAQVTFERLPVIEAIPLQMTQLFYNLLNNSLKFVNDKDSPIISIKCRVLNLDEKKELMLIENNTYYEIVIKDNGIGFDPEYVDQIFGLFKRLNDKQSYPGSGIGLALCKKVMDNHHGLIYAKSTENEGASFYVVLPEKQGGIKSVSQ